MNRPKLFFLTCICFLISSISAFSQESQSEREEELVSNQIISPDIMLQNNSATVMQVGNRNSATVFQQGQNLVMLNQNGNNNIGYVDQAGGQNRAMLTQSGNSNDAGLWTIGQNITLSANQAGNNNIINAYIENDGIGARIATLNQLGNNNQIDVALLGNGFIGSGNQTFEATQIGNGSSLTALIDPFQAPVSVTQTSGIGGAGMTLNISTTTFNFPMRQ
jgi:hypothetical protein